MCRDPKDPRTLENIAELVVKEVQGSGGYGMVADASTERAAFRKRIRANR
jgi:uncharacterized circularly permuted ATP-grasp superfamily protein